MSSFQSNLVAYGDALERERESLDGWHERLFGIGEKESLFFSL